MSKGTILDVRLHCTRARFDQPTNLASIHFIILRDLRISVLGPELINPGKQTGQEERLKKRPRPRGHIQMQGNVGAGRREVRVYSL